MGRWKFVPAFSTGAQAVDVLQKLLAAGYFHNRAQRDALAADRDLEVLRGRKEFQELLKKVAAVE